MSDLGFTPEEVAQFRKAFEHFDKNKDGTISLRELKSICEWMDIPATPDDLTYIV
jgi:Ca2+-binding EF-hand superfamily protein